MEEAANREPDMQDTGREQDMQDMGNTQTNAYRYSIAPNVSTIY